MRKETLSTNNNEVVVSPTPSEKKVLIASGVFAASGLIVAFTEGFLRQPTRSLVGMTAAGIGTTVYVATNELRMNKRDKIIRNNTNPTAK